jgi:hypothetical protein
MIPGKTASLKVLIILCCLSLNLAAQEKSKEYLDSLYNLMTARESNIKLPSPAIDTEPIKCGFPLNAEVKENLEYFTPEQQFELKKIMSRPELETSIVSPSGFFRIHYSRSGTGAPGYDESLSADENAMLAAEAFDSSYSYEISYLGYSEPPSDNGSGGDNLYDVYIINKGNTYGETHPETSLGNNRYTSYITIDDNFGTGFYTHGLEAMRVTAAHEFHHAIQLEYTYRTNDQFFMELTSVSMEEFVYDDVNDYYGYMPHYFNNTSRVFSRFSSGDGYDLAIWNIFLADTLGIDIIKRQWELMPQMNAVEAIQQSLNEKGTSFFEMMNLFGIWCYFTGYRAQAGMYFEEAENYPVVKSMDNLSFSSSSKTFSLNSPPLANTYVTFISTDANPDSLTVVLSNSNYKAALNTPGNTYPLDYTLYNYAAEGSSKLTGKYYYSFTPQNEYWSSAEMFPTQVIKGGYFLDDVIDIAFPSPFYYNKNSFIFIPADVNVYENTYLNVYSASMDLVYSSTVEIQKIYGQNLIKWAPKDNDGNNLATGIYIYALRSGDKDISGKIVIFNK